MIKSIREENNIYPEARDLLSYVKNGSQLQTLIPKRSPDMEYLSESDIECLDKAIDKIKDMSFSDLEKFSHDELYQTADINDEISIENIINYSCNPEELRDYLAG